MRFRGLRGIRLWRRGEEGAGGWAEVRLGERGDERATGRVGERGVGWSV